MVAQNDPWAEFEQVSGADPWAGFEVVEEVGPSRPLQAYDEGLRRGVTLGASDEISGGISAGTIGLGRGVVNAVQERNLSAIPREIGREYQESAARHRTEQKSLERSNPRMMLAGEVTGSLAPVTGAARPVMGAATLGGGIVRGGAAGAAGGATAGFFEDEGGFVDRVDGAASGGAIGTAFGSAFPVFGAGIARAWAARRAGRLKSQPKEVREAFNEIRDTVALDMGGNKNAAESYLRRWVKDGADPNTFLDDALPNTSALLREVAAERPTPALALINDWKDTAGQQVRDAVRGSLTPKGQGVQGEVRKLKMVREAQAAPLYERAFEQGIDREFYQGYLSGFVRDNPEAIRKGLRIARARGDQESVQQLQNALRGTEEVVNLRALQLFKEGVDDQISAARRSGSRNLASALTSRKRQWLDAIDAANPDYATARQLWAGTKEADDAIDFGKDFFQSRRTADDVASELEGMSDAQLDFVKVGVADAIELQVMRTLDASNPGRFIRKEDTRAKIQALFRDDPLGAEELISMVRGIEDRFAKRSYIAPTTGSQTELRQRTRERLDERVRSGVQRTMNEGAAVVSDPLGTPRRVTDRIFEEGFARNRSLLSDELSSILFEGNGMRFPPEAAERVPNFGGPTGVLTATQVPSGADSNRP